MLYKAHILTGITAGEIISLFYPIVGTDIYLFYMFIIFGSLLPDIDEPNSKISKMLPVWLGRMIQRNVKHRGFTHNILGLTSVTIISSYLFYYISPENLIGLFGFLLGYYIHIIIGDATTYSGVKNFLLISNSDLKIFNKGFYVGSYVEGYIYISLLWIQIFIACYTITLHWLI